MQIFALHSLGTAQLALCQPHARNLIRHTDIWMTMLMLYLPPLHFYRNNGTILMTAIALTGSILFITLPIFLVELLIGSFSNGKLTRAYGFNRFAPACIFLMMLSQFQNIVAITSMAHSILSFSMTFFVQNMNPSVSLWSCSNPWNTERCCGLISAVGFEKNVTADATKDMRARCSTPFEEFYKYYGNILHNGLHTPSSGLYDGGYAALASWMLLSSFIILTFQLPLRVGIKFVTYLITIPCLLLFMMLYVHCYSQPMTGIKIGNLIMRHENAPTDYIFTFFMPNLYHANHMMVAGGYLVVLHCCCKPHKTCRKLKSVISKNLIFLIVCLIGYKFAICILRQGSLAVSDKMRQLEAGTDKSARENFRDLFEDSKDWLYQIVFEYIEAVHVMRERFRHLDAFMILEGASILHPILLVFGFLGVRVALCKATWELLFQSIGFSELMDGPWQMFTRTALPGCILAVNFAAQSDICRELLFPKEPIGYAIATLTVVLFFPSFLHAYVAQKLGRTGRSIYWRMMEFAIPFRRRFIIVGAAAGFHVCGAQIFKNAFNDMFMAVLRSSKSAKFFKITHFFQYDDYIGVFGANALRVFTPSGPNAFWVLNDTFLVVSGCYCILLILMQSGRVFRYCMKSIERLHIVSVKLLRCMKYAIEFYIAVMFARR